VLAIRVVRELLVGFVEDGGQLFWPDTPNDPLAIREVCG
jgi:hypothetical protein